VRAVSVANSAVEVLRTDTDVPARSVAAELWQWSQDRERLGPRDLLIIDEATTLGTAWARDLLAEARTRGAVVVLLGDHRHDPPYAPLRDAFLGRGGRIVRAPCAVRGAVT
jgi:ATP-dependent exoDNAse (exonuclease V) alpha subunit